MRLVPSVTPQWSQVRDLLMPAVRASVGYERGPGVVEADLRIEYAEDRLALMVEHEICSRAELESGDYKRLFRPRLLRALLMDIPSSAARAARVERRQLQWRGENARKAKPRRSR